MSVELKQALHTALEFEQKGHNIYEEAAKNTENELVRRTFSYLAKQEVFHINEIKKYIEKNVSEVNLGGDSAEATQEFFLTTVDEFKQGVDKVSDNDLNAYRKGLELEEQSYDFYRRQFELATDDKAKKFFTFLMEQENAHYELLKKGMDYVMDPVSFYAREENWNFEGA